MVVKDIKVSYNSESKKIVINYSNVDEMTAEEFEVFRSKLNNQRDDLKAKKKEIKNELKELQGVAETRAIKLFVKNIELVKKLGAKERLEKNLKGIAEQIGKVESDISDYKDLEVPKEAFEKEVEEVDFPADPIVPPTVVVNPAS